MNPRFYPMSKVLLLISDRCLYEQLAYEIRQSSYVIEESLDRASECQLIVIDHFFFQSDIADHLYEMGVIPPLFLILNEKQLHQHPWISSRHLLQDILVVRPRASGESCEIISALRGRVSFQDIMLETMPSLSPISTDSEFLTESYATF